jgi:hypothetical protein
MIIVNLTINNSSISNLSLFGCNSLISPSGKYTWTISGIYTDTISNIAGCDSIISINLTINTLDTSVSVFKTTLTANATSVNYQWIDCNNGRLPISGATGQSYTATENGSYAVVVKQNSCSDTSSCYTIIGVGIRDIITEKNFAIYPNPMSGQFAIYFAETLPDLSITIYNTIGEELDFITYKEVNRVQLEIIEPAGLYFLKISTKDQTIIQQVIKK